MTGDLADLEEAPYNPATMAASTLMATKARRLKRPWVLLTLGIAIVVVISVITDFPKPISRAQDAADQNAKMKSINTDLAPCVFALNESLALLAKETKGQLTTSNLGQVSGLLVGDQRACSFASGAVNDLTNNIQVNDTKAGKYIDRLRGLVTLWVTNHALQSVDDVITLFKQPNNQSVWRHLAAQETSLDVERLQARSYVKDATKILGIRIIEPKLPLLRPLKG